MYRVVLFINLMVSGEGSGGYWLNLGRYIPGNWWLEMWYVPGGSGTGCGVWVPAVCSGGVVRLTKSNWLWGE